MRRAPRVLSTVLVVLGVLALTDAVATLAWKEPVSALYAKVQQDRLDDRLQALERAVPVAADRRVLRRLAPGGRRLAFAADAARRRAEPGDPVGRLRAGAIGLDEVVVEGTAAADLRRGPGHYPASPLPGARGTVAIAGHRTTYGAPFRRLDQLRRGSRITLAMPYGHFAYRVERSRVVAPSATWVTRRAAFDQLVLTACHPLYSAARRIVVFARLVAAEPRDAAA